MTERHRTVNQALGLQPRFGPVPSDQLFPWLAIAFTFYLVFNQALRFSWLWTGTADCLGVWYLVAADGFAFLPLSRQVHCLSALDTGAGTVPPSSSSHG
jgi:hypothetical protein